MRYVVWIAFIAASSAFWYNVGREESLEMVRRAETNVKVCDAQLAMNLAQTKEEKEHAERLRANAIVAIYE